MTPMSRQEFDEYMSKLTDMLDNDFDLWNATQYARIINTRLRHDLHKCGDDESYERACQWAVMCMDRSGFEVAEIASRLVYDFQLMSVYFEQVHDRLINPYARGSSEDFCDTDAELRQVASSSEPAFKKNLAMSVLRKTNEVVRSRYQTKIYHDKFLRLYIILAPIGLPALVLEAIARFVFGRRRTQLVPFHVTYGMAENVTKHWCNRKASGK